MRMTKAEALRIQAEQVAYYGAMHPQIPVAKLVAAATRAEELAEGEHDVIEINGYIPRGAAIEWLIGKVQA